MFDQKRIVKSANWDVASRMAAPFISSREEVGELRDQLGAEGRKLVLTNGVFDLLHAGHVRYLKEARALGDCLVVAINADESVRELKGAGRPVYPAEERAEILRALRAVDRVVVFGEKRASRTIEIIRPHIYTKGGDYTPDSLIDEEKQLLDRLGIDVRILSLVPGKSTSATLRHLERGGGAQEGPGRRIAILGSGRGSNCEAILDAIASERLDAEPVLVISDIADARILSLARDRGVSALHVDPGSERPGRLSAAALKEIVDRLEAARVDLVIPARSAFEGRILNIHPSLLPLHPGRDACRSAIEAGDSESGCTVHIVDAGIDTGPILDQARVPVLPGDTPDTLQERIHRAEHELYPRTVGEMLDRLEREG